MLDVLQKKKRYVSVGEKKKKLVQSLCPRKKIPVDK